MKNKRYMLGIGGIIAFVIVAIMFVIMVANKPKVHPATVTTISSYERPAIKETQEIEPVVINGVPGEVVSKSLIVRFNDEVTKEQAQSVISKLGVSESYNIAKNFWEIRFADKIDLAEKITELEPIREIERVGYNGVYYPQYKPDDYIPETATEEAWWLENINAPTAWDITTGDDEVVVAIFDTPVDFLAPDLIGKGSQVVPVGESALIGTDHGSHVAGIVGAATDNGIGVASIGFNTSLLSFAICVPNCEFALMLSSFQEVMDRIDVGENIKVINQSYAGPTKDDNVLEMIRDVQAKGVVLVGGVGNEFGRVLTDEGGNPLLDVNGNQIMGSYYPLYPAAHKEVIAVAAHKLDNQLTGFSTRNDPSSSAQDDEWVDVSAPGEDIISTFPDGSYVSWSGTSMASPMVAGIVALCFSVNPGLTVQEAMNIVFSTALEKPLDGVTYGQVDAEKIVRACKDPGNYVPDQSDKVCSAWNTSYVLPGISGNRTHPAPSFALENRYYVLGQNDQEGKAWWANQQGNGSLGAWVEATFEAWSQQGYSAVVAKNHAYILRNGHILDMKDGGAQTLTDTELAPGGNGFNGNNMVWDTAVTATFGNKQFIYHLGGFDMGRYNYVNVIHSAEVPDGGFTAGTRFNQLSQTTPTSGSPGDGSGAQYKAAFIAGSDGNSGYIFMGQAGSNALWRIKAMSDGSLQGSWGQVSDLPSGTDNQRGDLLSYGNYLYSIRGRSFYRIQVNTGDGSFTGAWETLALLPSAQVGSSFTWGGNHPEGASYGIMNGFLYVTSDEYVYSISLTGDCETLPVPTPTPQRGNGGSGAVGEKISCVVPEWVVRGPDIVVPPITCEEASIEVANPAYVPPPVGGGNKPNASTVGGVKCEQCAQAYVFPKPDFSPSSPTNQDVGQKDGTGQSGTERKYFYFDYERGLVINVPPFGFGIGGPAPIVGDPDNNSSYDVPCGWPSPDKNRLVTLGCATKDSFDSADKICPNGMAAGSWCGIQSSILHGQHDGYNAMDVAGEFAIQSTMDGMAYRCVDTTVQDQFGGSFGIYVVVVGPNFRTLYAHMRPESKDSNGVTPLPAGTECVYGALKGEVERFQVKRGDVLGYVGTTGDTSGSHLHYEIRLGGAHAVSSCPASYMDQTHPYCQPGAVVQQNGVVASVQNFLQSLNPFRSGDEVEVGFPGHPSE